MILGLDGLIAKYKQSLSRVTLFGPTLFNEIFNKMLKFMKDIQKKQEKQDKGKQKNIYHILLMLTDGEVHDMR